MTVLTASGYDWMHPFRRLRMLTQVWMRVRVNQFHIARAFPRSELDGENGYGLRRIGVALAKLAAPRPLPLPLPEPRNLLPSPAASALPEPIAAAPAAAEEAETGAPASTPAPAADPRAAAKKEAAPDPGVATVFAEQLTPSDHRKIHNRLEAWRAAWSARDIEAYAEQLHPKFSEAHGTKRETFLILQKSAFLSRNRILVRFLGAAAIRLAARDLVRAQVRLDYEEDGAGGPRKSQSARTVWLRKENDEWLISKI